MAQIFGPEIEAPEIRGTPRLYELLRRILRGQEVAAAIAAAPGLPLILFVEGVLAIGSDLCPQVSLASAVTPARIRATVKAAPAGADLKMAVLYGAQKVYVTISAGTTVGALAPVPQIPANANIRLDLVQVGTTSPGSDLSVRVE